MISPEIRPQKYKKVSQIFNKWSLENQFRHKRSWEKTLILQKTLYKTKNSLKDHK